MHRNWPNVFVRESQDEPSGFSVFGQSTERDYQMRTDRDGASFTRGSRKDSADGGLDIAAIWDQVTGKTDKKKIKWQKRISMCEVKPKGEAEFEELYAKRKDS